MTHISRPFSGVALVAVLLMPMAAQALPEDSLFFSPNQIISIMRANQGFIAPQEAISDSNQTDRPTDPGPRVLTLAGIAYQTPREWTIWLNGERVTPKNIPERIMGLTVKKDRIFLKWMDIANQRIVNLVLRPHQNYHLDTDTITPGT